MKRSNLQASGRRAGRRAFTLIEVLVVVAIIGLLIAILMPSLQSARRHAKAVACLANLRHIGQAVGAYLSASNGTYPAAYVYPTNEGAAWTPLSQSPDHPFGYLHWSHLIFDDGRVDAKALQCPATERGDAPRPNPGRDQADWEPGQVDQTGASTPGELTDRQAPRMAYTANAAVMPRNKFTQELSDGPRVNQLVRDSRLRHTGRTVLMTEFLDNWRALGFPSAGGVLSLSHRPINPFYHLQSGFNEYQAAVNSVGFIYGVPDDLKSMGVLPEIDVRDRVNILDSSSGVSPINAVGRHHPTGDKVYRERFGGAANFLFCDGHAEPLTPLESLKKERWGYAYHSLTGRNEITNGNQQGESGR